MTRLGKILKSGAKLLANLEEEIFLMLLFIFLISFTVAQNSSSKSTTPEVEACRHQYPSKPHLTTLEGMVGTGWDNLRNIPMAKILSSKFDLCKTTPDGDYLVPDHMQVIPVKKVNLDKTANYYDKFEDYFHSEADTINFEEGLTYKHFSLSGSFDAKFQDSRDKFIAEKTVLFHTALKYHAYTVLVQSQTELDEDFLAKLYGIYGVLKKGLMRKAKYLAELIIRDFGTHVITKAEVGASIEQEDYLDSKTVSDQQSSIQDFRYAAAASFENTISAKFSTSTTKNISYKTQEAFNSALKHTKIYTNGGPSVNRLLGMNVSGEFQPQKFIEDVVVIDRSGVPLYTLITQEALPNIPGSYIDQIALLVKNATEEYYNRNRIDGCMDPKAPNFYPSANVNDSTCHKPYTNFTFGGAYQKCTISSSEDKDVQYRCDGMRQVNGDTGDYTCGSDFQAVRLMYIQKFLPDRVEKRYKKECNQANSQREFQLHCDNTLFKHRRDFLLQGSHVFWETCTTYVYDIIFKDVATIETYACQATSEPIVHQDRGFMFGGLFGKNRASPFTGAMTCPGRFIEYTLFDITICLSKDYQLDRNDAVGFGGFFSCQASKEDAKCDAGYSQHLATVVEGCEVYYCVRPEEFKRVEQTLIKRPPYTDPFAMSNETESMIFGYVNDTLWLKRSVGSVLSEMNVKLLTQKPENATFDTLDVNMTLAEPPTTLQLIDQWLDSIEIPQEIKEKHADTSSPWILVQKSPENPSGHPYDNMSMMKIIILALIGLGILCIGVGAGIGVHVVYRKYKIEDNPGPLLSQFQQPIIVPPRASIPYNEYNAI